MIFSASLPADSQKAPWTRLPLALACTMLISACGGGGGGNGGFGIFVPSPAPPAPAPAPVDCQRGPGLAVQGAILLEDAQACWNLADISAGAGGDSGGDGGVGGAAGDGSPLEKVSVTLTDAEGRQVSGLTDDNGRFLLRFKRAEFTPPFVVRTIDASGKTLISVSNEAPDAGKAVRVNVNPLTDKIGSDLLKSTVQGTDKQFNGDSVEISRLEEKKADMKKSIQAALAITGISAEDVERFDPVRSVYPYDGTGVDAVVESISHARNPETGATELRAKLASLGTDADGAVNPPLITAETPLSPNDVAIESNPKLTFGKLDTWIKEVNRCFALSIGTRQTDSGCQDLNGDTPAGARLVAANFKHDGKNFRRAYSTLHVAAGSTAPQGSMLSNPSILYFDRSAGSATDDLAIVQMTVTQRESASADSPLIRYPASFVFQQLGASGAVAGNWILAGNQHDYAFRVQPEYWRESQLLADGGLQPYSLTPMLAFDLSAGEHPDVHAVRAKGPGLPAEGLVFARGQPGDTQFSIANKTGRVDAPSLASAASNGRRFFLQWLYRDFDNSYLSENPAFASPAVTDFSGLRAYNSYRFELFRNGDSAPFAAQSVRIETPVLAPQSLPQLPSHDFMPAVRRWLTAPQEKGCSFDLAWSDNAAAAPVAQAQVFGLVSDGQGNTLKLGSAYSGPQDVRRIDALGKPVRVSSLTATANDCLNQPVPALDGGEYNGSYRSLGFVSLGAGYQLTDHFYQLQTRP